MSDRQEIFQKALNLSRQVRADLIDRLEESLASTCFASPRIAEAWMAVVERRAAAIARGEMGAEDWHVAMQQLRADLHQHRGAGTNHG